jgi:hypothetical protein
MDLVVMRAPTICAPARDDHPIASALVILDQLSRAGALIARSHTCSRGLDVSFRDAPETREGKRTVPDPDIRSLTTGDCQRWWLQRDSNPRFSLERVVTGL